MKRYVVIALLAGPVLAAPAVAAEEMSRAARSQVTEIWEPVPASVATPEGQPPSDAVVLFDGTGFDAWEAEGEGEIGWTLDADAMTVAPGTGGIRTKDSFCDAQLHVEWRAPRETDGFDGQDRGNSGIFLQERYEVQVLDSSSNPTYANGQAGSVYKQHAPLVNASRAPGDWQSYDILFEAPIFSEAGVLRRPAYVTVLHNGVVVQNHAQIQGPTVWIGAPRYEAHGCAPIFLQDHASEVSYRNIWLRPL